MKENQNEKPQDTKSLQRQTDSVYFGNKADPSAFEVKGRNDSYRKENLNEIEFVEYFNVNDKVRMSENVQSVEVEKFTQCNKNELIDSSLICISASDLFETEMNLYSDKSALQSKLPDSIVSQKESNMVKDICVDEGVTMNDKILNECCKDGDKICKGLEGGADNTKGVDEVECESKQEGSFDKDVVEQCDIEDESIGNIVNNESKDKSLVDGTLPVQDFVTQSFVGSLSTSDSKDKSVVQLPDQIPSESLTASSTDAKPTEDIQSSRISYNSKVETRSSITFNFNSPAQKVSGITTGTIKDINQQSVESTISKENNTSDEENVKETSPVQNEAILDDRSATDENNSNNNHRNSGNASVASRLQYDDGESSFSAAPGLISYSGQIAYSGSLSLRPDGSTTSGKSFTFPVLQSEWNSSPVRMAKADGGRNFRKHRGWRSGLLCCRF